MNNLTIEDYLQEIKISLRNQNSLLSEFVIGSNIYIIFRAIAETLSRRDNRVNSAVDSLSILTATGSDLDILGDRYGVSRKLGIKAKGSILVENFVGEITKGTIFETLDSTYQYSVTEDTLVDNINIRGIPIEAVSIGPDYNLSPGTSLKSSFLYNNSIKVGASINNNRYTGFISGGENREEDLDYRLRLIEILQQDFIAKGSYLNITREIAEEIPGIEFYIVEDYPTPSVFTLFVDSLNQSIQNTLDSVLTLAIPIGVRYQILPLSYNYIDLEISVTGTIDSDLDVLRQSILDFINAYFTSRSVGQAFIKNDLISIINTGAPLKALSINYPLVDIVPVDKNIKIKPNNINISLSK